MAHLPLPHFLGAPVPAPECCAQRLLAPCTRGVGCVGWACWGVKPSLHSHSSICQVWGHSSAAMGTPVRYGLGKCAVPSKATGVRVILPSPGAASPQGAPNFWGCSLLFPTPAHPWCADEQLLEHLWVFCLIF